MKPISFKRHRFPADVVRHALWLYFHFSLSLRDVEELLAQRRIEVSYETIRCWTIKCRPQLARRLKPRRPGSRRAEIWTRGSAGSSASAPAGRLRENNPLSTPVSRTDDENVGSSGSDPTLRRRDISAPTPKSTTPPTPSLIWSTDPLSATLAPRLHNSGRVEGVFHLRRLV